MGLRRDTDENCYPFLHEASALCDFEVATDSLCGHIGAAVSLLAEPGMDDIRADLALVQPLAFHANGSLRGRLAVGEQDIAWLKQRLAWWRAQPGGRVAHFVLPRGGMPVPFLHLGRSACKQAVRALVRVRAEGRVVPEQVPRLLEVLCNLLFTLALVINHRRGLDEVPFHSLSYGPQPPR